MPGATTFVVVVSDTPEASLTVHGQAAGLHQFKAVGRNSQGAGPESAVTEATVAAAGVA